MYLDLKIKLGKQPTIRQFSETYKVSNEKMALILGRNAFSKLVTLCGDKPVSFGRDKSSLEKVLFDWGNLVRLLKVIPTQTEWKMSGNTPSVSGISQSHNIKWSEIPIKFHSQYKDSKEWIDVIELIENVLLVAKNISSTKKEECFVYLMKDKRNNAFKIGISNDAIYREKTLRSEDPKVELMAKKKFVNRKIAGAIEKALHNVYLHKNIRGEWFKLGDEDIKELLETLND